MLNKDLITHKSKETETKEGRRRKDRNQEEKRMGQLL